MPIFFKKTHPLSDQSRKSLAVCTKLTENQFVSITPEENENRGIREKQKLNNPFKSDATFASRYSRMDQVKFVEDSL